VSPRSKSAAPICCACEYATAQAASASAVNVVRNLFTNGVGPASGRRANPARARRLAGDAVHKMFDKPAVV
jgi:hypothetical protein